MARERPPGPRLRKDRIGGALGMFDLGLALLVLVLVVLLLGIRIVPQGEAHVVERLGRYHRTMQPGLNLIVPVIDRVRYKMVTKDLILDVKEQEVITRDNAVIRANAVAFVRVVDPFKAAYGVTNFALAIENLIMTTLRSIIGDMDLDEALSSREIIKTRLKEAITDEASDWGLHIRTVEIQDIRPSPSMQQAMEQQAAAERERKAMVTRAEGEKQSSILRAEARLEAARREAEARLTMARAYAQSLEEISKALGEGARASDFVLGERYVAALEALLSNPSTRAVVVPADLDRLVGGILNRAR